MKAAGAAASASRMGRLTSEENSSKYPAPSRQQIAPRVKRRIKDERRYADADRTNYLFSSRGCGNVKHKYQNKMALGAMASLLTRIAHGNPREKSGTILEIAYPSASWRPEMIKV